MKEFFESAGVFLLMLLLAAVGITGAIVAILAPFVLIGAGIGAAWVVFEWVVNL